MLSGALWVLEQEAKVWDKATGNARLEKDTNPNSLFPMYVGLAAQTAVITTAGHSTVARAGFRIREYAKHSHRLVFPAAGSSYKAGFRIIAKNKWLVRGARIGGRFTPGLNIALAAYDIYSVGKWANLW